MQESVFWTPVLKKMNREPWTGKPASENPSPMLGCLVLLVGLLILLPGAALAKYIQLDGVIGVKSRFSSGCSTIEETAELAKQVGVDVVIFTDHARNSLQYGIFPFERLVKKTLEWPSILTTGAASYLSEIQEEDRRFKDTLLIPGAEAAPFYYWTGSIFKNDLIAHGWNKRLDIIGLHHAEDLEQLPLLNSNFSKQYMANFQAAAIGLGFLFLITVAMALKGINKKVSIPAAILFGLLILNNHPFKSSPFDQYHGDQGIKPYQEVIDFANSREALVFWKDLDGIGGKRDLGAIHLENKAHPEDLVLAREYTGFEAVAADPVSVTDPGNTWDHILTQYLRRERAHPVWGYGGNGYECQGQAGPQFGAVRTIFLVREKTRKAVMQAMKTGRMYAVRQPGPNRLSMDEFIIKDKITGKEAAAGEEINLTDVPEITLKIRSAQGEAKRARIYLIRNGQIVRRETVSLPHQFNWRDKEVDMTAPAFYRIKATVSSVDYLVSNPIFVRFGKLPAETASAPPGADQAPPPQKPIPPRINIPQPPGAPESQSTEKPELARLNGPDAPAAAKVPPPPPPPIPETIHKPAVPKIVQPSGTQAEKSPSPSEKKYVRVLIDGVSLKKGPGAVFPEVEKVNKGQKLLLIRKTKVAFDGKVWLVVKTGDRLAYIWGGLVKEE
ncbi:MAG: hypothetical protein ACE5E9_02535 [Nitrospinaceae bacterium]